MRKVSIGRLVAALAGAAALVLLGQVEAGRGEPRTVGQRALSGVPGLPGPLAPDAPPAPQGVALLVSYPDSGKVGTKFKLVGEGLPRDTAVDIVWGTWQGSYVMKPSVETVEFYERRFEPVRVVLASPRTNAEGRLDVELTVPQDYGEFHDIHVVANGFQIGKGRFRVARSVTFTPSRGPVGALVKIKSTGLGWKPYESTVAVRYDNKYTGFMSATTTRGTATAQIRAAGPLGSHVIEVDGASAAVPYLNIEQSPVYYIGKFEFTFTVTKDTGPPPPRTDWPERAPASQGSKTTVTAGPTLAPGVAADLSPQSGPIRSRVRVDTAGLAPGAPVGLVWVTAVGNRVSPSGWSLKELPLSTGMAGADGRLAHTFSVPDDLGGWHTLRLVQLGKVAAELPYFVERSLAAVTPRKVKAGQVFQVRLKGIGWTELDNGVAVTYDNAYIGYACGFNSQGDVTMRLVATGGPGTHLIDIYPMIYQGKGKPPWSYQNPILSFKQDAPGLALGYRLPAFRLAIKVVS